MANTRFTLTALLLLATAVLEGSGFSGISSNRNRERLICMGMEHGEWKYGKLRTRFEFQVYPQLLNMPWLAYRQCTVTCKRDTVSMGITRSHDLHTNIT